LDYPKNRLEIQVLDDSTDETTQLIAHYIPRIQQMGISVEHLRRADRSGFKAGALAEAMKKANGELIAIFDADFVPPPEFLCQLLPYFADSNTGLVQARWAHLNPSHSWLTRCQAFLLDAHMYAEQRGRDSAGYLITFNGTAGMWRKDCITDAGGWQSDTLTEDLDLSYRAQLRGWQLRYAGQVSAPAELPLTLQALKAQQYRWMKGIAECARKHLLTTMQSSRLSAASKV
jgi:cellulose synthase/poly-beta-1,6-N-acetylglucosamine synthase-like glycosyltransferase